MTWQLGSCNLRHLLILHTFNATRHLDQPRNGRLRPRRCSQRCIRTPSGARQIRRASGRNARVAGCVPNLAPRSDSTVSSDTITRNRPQRAPPAVISAAVAPKRCSSSTPTLAATPTSAFGSRRPSGARPLGYPEHDWLQGPKKMQKPPFRTSTSSRPLVSKPCGGPSELATRLLERS